MERAPPPRGLARLLAGLFALALGVRVVTALCLRQPGYFDAWYYHHVAQNLAAGRGHVEDLVWNYLDPSPAAMRLPRPSHLYWMPLASWLAAGGIRLLGPLAGAFRAAQAPFVLASAALPPLAAWVSHRVWGRRDLALRAGLYAVFPGTYALYLVVPDGFAPYALAAALAFVACARGAAAGGGRAALGWWLAAGAGVGLAHLTRADGALLGLAVAWCAARAPRAWPRRVLGALAAAAGYGAVVAPWLARNVRVAGAALPGGGLRTAWLRSYDEVFAYGLRLDVHHLLADGAGAVAAAKLRALAWDALVLVALVQVVLAPFVVAGLRAARGHDRGALLRPARAYAVVLLVVLPLVYTHPSTRGSLLHSFAALLPWAYALVPAGVEAAAERFARWRGEDPARAARVLGAGGVAVAAALTLATVVQSVWLAPASRAEMAPWNARFAHYPRLARWLAAREPRGPVVVLWTPAWVGLTGRPAIVTPTNGLAAVTAAADRFGARWLVVERDHPRALRAAYARGVAPPGWVRVEAPPRDDVGAPVRVFRRAPAARAERSRSP